MSSRLIQLELFALAIPFRHRPNLYGEPRQVSQTVVAAALLADGTVGYGEGLPCYLVTGETVESVLYNIEHTLAPAVKNLEPNHFGDVLECVAGLPFYNEQELLISSARCCVELALLDAYSRFFRTRIERIVGWLNYGPFLGDTGDDRPATSAVLDLSDLTQTRDHMQYLLRSGLRDFKLLMTADDAEQLPGLIDERLQKGIFDGSVNLRVDAQGAWDIDKAIDLSEKLDHHGFCCLEQPLAVDDESHFQILSDLVNLPLMADESLLTLEDAEFLAQNDLVDYFNITLSKNGGLIPSLRLAESATKRGRGYQVGAMPGETGILAAAGRQFLQMVPPACFSEVDFSGYLLEEDLVEPAQMLCKEPLKKNLQDFGLGFEISHKKIGKFLAAPSVTVALA